MTAPEVPHADLIARLRYETRGWQRVRDRSDWPADIVLMVEAADALAALGDTVPREQYDQMQDGLVRRAVTAEAAVREARAERDALAVVIEQAWSWSWTYGHQGAPTEALRNLLRAAPAVSLALHDAEVKAQALDEASHALWVEHGGPVRRSLRERAAAIREEAGS